MSAKNPKISIITINFNNAVGLKETITTVVEQSYRLIEYIVIDGASTDGSVEVIEAKENHLSYWVSEPDTGIYNAMNKGIGKATGDYVLFLNSGDRLINSKIVEEVVAEGLTHDLNYGDLLFFTDEKEWLWHLPSTLTFEDLYKSTIPHPTTFIKRDLFNKIGLYDESLNIVSDWKFFLLAMGRYNFTFKHIDKVISAYSFDGLSSKPENLLLINSEREQVLKENFPFFIHDYQRLIAMDEEMKKIKYFTKTRRFIKKIFNQK